MINNQHRIGNFTSSEIVALTKKGKDRKSFGAPALTYIEECKMERRLGRSLSTEVDARATSWGSLVESRVFDLLGLEYRLCSKETLVHPDFPFWAGSPDGDKTNTVPDFKCPLTLKSFCQLVDPIYEGFEGIDAMARIREEHKDGEKYYWQIVSNSCIKGYEFGELIVYMPYLEELLEIKEMARRDGSGKYKWIDYADINELPYLLPGGYYRNLNVIRFEIPKADKKVLTETVVVAGKLLINNAPLVLAHHDAEVSATIVQDENALKV